MTVYCPKQLSEFKSKTISSYSHMRCWSWKVAGIEATGHHSHELSGGCTRLTFSMPWWAAPYLLVCGLALRRIRKILEAGDDLPQ